MKMSAFKCSRCGSEFFYLFEYMQHRKVCLRELAVLEKSQSSAEADV